MTNQPTLFDEEVDRREFHPLGDIVPVLAGFSEDQLDFMAWSVKRLGLRKPIVVHTDGRIIDGRLRYLACIRAKVMPTYETLPARYTDAMIIEYLCSVNHMRQHLTTDQQAAMAAAVPAGAR
jgi:hypothetical protein